MSRPPKSYALWIVGHCLKLLFTLLIAAVCFFMIWRVFISANPPAAMDRLAPNEALVAAYRAHGNDLQLYNQKQPSITKGDENYGYFGVTHFVFIPEAGQLQLTLRYNNSTLKYTKEALGLPERPPRGEEVFDVSVVQVVDLTPDNLEDNTDGSITLQQVRFSPTSHIIDTTALYTYILYTFDGVTVGDDTVAAYLDVYYGLTPDYTTTAFGTLRLYHRDDPKLEVKLTAKEEKLLKEYEN